MQGTSYRSLESSSHHERVKGLEWSRHPEEGSGVEEAQRNRSCHALKFSHRSLDCSPQGQRETIGRS